MKLSAVFFTVVLCAITLFAQAPAPAAKPKPAAPAKAKPAPATRTKPAAGLPSASEKASTAPAAAAADGSKVVMTVGDQKITEKEFDQLIEALPEQARAQARGPMKRQMGEQIVRVKLLADQAKKKGLDQDPGVQARIRFQTENLLAGAAFSDLQKSAKVDEPAVRKYYEEHKGEFETAEARHILIKFKGSPVPAREGKAELTEEEALAKAQEIRKKLLSGGDFAALAKAESDDTGSGANGGELGKFGHGQMVPEFDKAAFSLPLGQVSEPIRTQFGYHLIRVDNREAKTFDDIRPQLEERMRPEAARASLEALRKSASVVLDESYFGPETAAPPAQAAPAAPAPSPTK